MSNCLKSLRLRGSIWKFNVRLKFSIFAIKQKTMNGGLCDEIVDIRREGMIWNMLDCIV